MFKFDVFVIVRDPRDSLAPQLRCLQHVSLIDRSYFPTSFASCFEGNSRHTFYLFDGVAHCVNCRAGPVRSAEPAWLAKIQSAEEFTDDENVSTTPNFSSQR